MTSTGGSRWTEPSGCRLVSLRCGDPGTAPSMHGASPAVSSTRALSVRPWFDRHVFFTKAACHVYEMTEPELANIGNSPQTIKVTHLRARPSPAQFCARAHAREQGVAGRWVRLQQGYSNITAPVPQARGDEWPALDPRRQAFAYSKPPCRAGRGGGSCPFNELTQEFLWQPDDCRVLSPMTPTAWLTENLVKALQTGLRPRRAPGQSWDDQVHIYFVGDSTTFYTCKIFATMLATGTDDRYWRGAPKKFTGEGAMEEEAHTRGRLRIHCLRKPRGITPEQTSETLPKLAKKKGTGMIVFGESTAHYVCKDRAEPSYHTSSNGVMVINETTFVRRHEELVRVLQDIRAARFENNDPPLTFVWLGPMRTTIKSYQGQAAKLIPALNGLWGRVDDETNGTDVIALDTYSISHAAGYEQTADGLHYHQILYRGDKKLSASADKTRFSGCKCGDMGAGAAFEYSGAVPAAAMRVMVTAVMTRAFRARFDL